MWYEQIYVWHGHVLWEEPISCRRVKPNRKWMTQDLLPQNNWLKWCNSLSRTGDTLTAMVWRNKRDIHTQTKMHQPTRNGNYCDEHGNAINPEIIWDQNRYKDYADSGDRMIKQLPDTSWDKEVDKTTIFSLTSHNKSNSFILLTACGTKLIHGDFWLKLTKRAGSLPYPYHTLRECGQGREKEWSQVQDVWCETVPWWVFWRLPN